jgi:hypothetical protein
MSPITGSVGKNGNNKYWDVLIIRSALLELIEKKLIGVKKPILASFSGICDENMIHGIEVFQATFGTKFPLDGLIKPNDLTNQMMHKLCENLKAMKKPEWKYDSSTGWGVGGGVIIQGALVSPTLYVIDSNNPSNKFKVKCFGGQVSVGISLGSPISIGGEYSGKDHPSTGGKIKRMPKGNDPLTPEDFEGVVLMEGASGQIGSLNPTSGHKIPNKGTFAVVKTFSLSNLPLVLAVVGGNIGGSGFAGTAPAIELARKHLDRSARTEGWTFGGSAAVNLDAAGVEGFTAVFRSRIESGW